MTVEILCEYRIDATYTSGDEVLFCGDTYCSNIDHNIGYAPVDTRKIYGIAPWFKGCREEWLMAKEIVQL